MSANAVGSPSMVKVAIAPATWDTLDGALFDEGSGITELDKMLKHIGEGNLTLRTHMTDESESPDAPSALLTVTTHGVAPFSSDERRGGKECVSTFRSRWSR